MAKGDPQLYNTFNCSKHMVAATTIGSYLTTTFSHVATTIG